MIAAVALYAIVTGALLALVGALADRAAALGRRPRRWIWVGALAATIGLAVAAPWRSATDDSAAAALLASSAHIAAEAEPHPVAVATSRSSWTTVRADVRERVEAVAIVDTDLDPILTRIWLASSATVAIIVLAGWLALARRRRQWRDAVVNDELVLVAPVTGPAVVGLVSPRIVLPEWALSLDAASMDLILRHEREHVRAGDTWLMHVAVLTVVAMPWNPLVWWMASRLRLAVELDCDARVVGVHADSSADALAYGELLLAVVERRPRRRLLAAPALVETSSSLGRRIAALFPDVVRFAAARAAVAVVAALSVAGLAAMVPLPRVAAAPAIEGVDAAVFDVVPAQPSSTMIGDPEMPALIASAAAPSVSAPIDASPYASATTTRAMEMEVEEDAADARAPVPARSVSSEFPVASAPIPTSALAMTSELAAASAPLSAPAPAFPATLLPPPPAPAAPAPTAARVYDAATPGLVLPVPVRVERPRYTNAAMRERLSGRVIVEALVDPDGRVSDVRVIESLDREFGLDASAVEAAKQAVFRPGLLDGVAVPVAVAMELAFSIY